MVNKESVMFYKRNGYYIEKRAAVKEPSLILGEVLYDIDNIVVQQLRRLTKKFYLPSANKLIVHAHMAELLSLDKNAYIASLKLAANLLSVNALICLDKIVKTVGLFGIELPVLQTTPVLHVMADNLRIPGGYYGIGVHQDWPSLQGSLDTVIVWIPLMDVDRNNYPVEIIPGSHLGGLYPGTVSEQLYETDPRFYDQKDFIPAELEMGDVLYMSSFLLHRTALNSGESIRIACSNRYENACEPTYVQRIYPHAQKRVVNREFIHSDFPPAGKVREIFESVEN